MESTVKKLCPTCWSDFRAVLPGCQIVNKLYLWEDRVFYLGQLPLLSEHRLGAAALCMGVDNVFQVLESEDSQGRTCRSVLIPPGCLHEIHTATVQMAILFLDPESEQYTLLQNIMTEGEWQCLYRLVHEDQGLAILCDLNQSDYGSTTVYDLLDNIIDPRKLVPHAHRLLDARIQKVVQLIKEDISQSSSVEALANNINLSPTRLVHLFKEQTGVPIRRFRQWHRMKAVAALVAAGENLTDAALNAGFSDSAHFSRAFKNMFGMKPSFFFNRSADVQIIIG